MDTIEIIDDRYLCVVDEDGNMCDAASLTSLRKAQRQIQEWTREYTINVADAYRQVVAYFWERV